MAKDRYASQRKTARNMALFDYVEANDQVSFADVGREFNVTKQRAHEIYKRVEELKQAAAEAAA